MKSSKLKLTLLLTFTLVPILLATWYYSISFNSTGRSTSNKGVLLSPLLDLVELRLQDAAGEPAYLSFDELTDGVDPDDYDPRPWQLLFFNEGECGENCQERLYFLRQVHIRLGKESGRVRRAFVQVKTQSGMPNSLPVEFQAVLDAEQLDLRVVFGDRDVLEQQLKTGIENQDPIAENYIYVADPLGNIMLYFTPENTPDEIMSDIDRLLDQSSLG